MKYRLVLQRLLVLLTVVFIAMPSTAADDETIITIGRWTTKNKKPRIKIALKEFLTKKQKSIINGGFTTISDFVLKKPLPDSNNTQPKSVYNVRCSVKFDAWEETYDIAKLDVSPKSKRVKKFDDYAAMCLNAEITSKKLLAQFATNGGTLIATLIVKQTSVEEAQKIKSWLIEQQSGVMAGLFSHMLGELTLHQKLQVRVSIPARPQALGIIPSVKRAKPKQKDKG